RVGAFVEDDQRRTGEGSNPLEDIWIKPGFPIDANNDQVEFGSIEELPPLFDLRDAVPPSAGNFDDVADDGSVAGIAFDNQDPRKPCLLRFAIFVFAHSQLPHRANSSHSV